MYIRGLEDEKETEEKSMNIEILIKIQVIFLITLVFLSLMSYVLVSMLAFIAIFFGGISSVLILNIIIVGIKIYK